MERPETIAAEYAPAGRGEWLHFVYGHVPHYNQDYILVPAANTAALTEQHTAYLGEPLKYLEPLQAESYALAFVNLSAGSAQQGALALVLSVRLGGGVRDAKNRRHPLLTHAIATADRDFAASTLLRTAESLRAALIGSDPGSRPVDVWYSDYALRFNELVADPEARSSFFADYLRRFEQLPLLPARSEPVPLRSHRAVPAADPILCVRHSETTPPDELLPHAARIAGLLCKSEIGWSQITVGAAPHLQSSLSSSGLQVVFLPERMKLPMGQSALELSLDSLPRDPGELARALGLQIRSLHGDGDGAVLAPSSRKEAAGRPVPLDVSPSADSGGSSVRDPFHGNGQSSARIPVAPSRTWLATTTAPPSRSSPYASAPPGAGTRRWVSTLIASTLLSFALGTILGRRGRPVPLLPAPGVAQIPACVYECTCEPPSPSAELRERTFAGRVQKSEAGCPEPRCVCSFPKSADPIPPSAAPVPPSIAQSAPGPAARPQVQPPPPVKRHIEAHTPARQPDGVPAPPPVASKPRNPPPQDPPPQDPPPPDPPSTWDPLK